MSAEPIQCKAAVVRTPGGDFSVEQIVVAPPQAGEVRVKLLYSSLCHSDITFWKQPFSPLPFILGHEGSGIVESVGDGVTDSQPGDHVISVFQSECKQCKLCKMDKTNLCTGSNSIGGVMASDNKTRFSSMDGQPIYHFLNCSTFTEYTVMPEASLAKLPPHFPLEKASLLSCGVPTGLGSVLNIAKVEAGSTVAVIGLGTVGLAVVEGAKIAGASRIIAIDIQPSKFGPAKSFGATDVLNPKDYETSIDKVVQELTDGGVDYSFECVGKPQLMLDALECCAKYGTSVIVGLPGFTDTITFAPMIMMSGRQWKSGLYGGYKSTSQIHRLVQMCTNQEVNLDAYITHKLPFSSISEGIQLLATSSCIKCVFNMDST